ncbi:hypothetical protein PIB30_035615 [Stylosanthes scabra]|uniref:Uncharacterized protein n=1 Tax=Stylosanthes scabra TaxID=79078 RepID=A0ABU6YBZ4_9FABA|nr:hypothetical protein [Stylosanthes scabra]
MGSGVIYYEYEKREKFEDYDLKADVVLGTFKIRRYHFDDESFVHPLQSVRFDPNRPYEVPIEALMDDQPLSSSNKGSLPLEDLIVPDDQVQRRITHQEGWMCEEDEGEKEIEGMELSVEKEEVSEKEEEEEDPEEEEDEEEDPEEDEEEDPEEEAPDTTSLPMDIDATEDYLQFIEELECHPGYSPIHSGQASVPDLPKDPSDRRSISHSAPSYDLSGIWPSPSSGPSI